MNPWLAILYKLLLLIVRTQLNHPMLTGPPKRMWELPLISKREEEGMFYTLYEHLRDGTNPSRCHHEYFRMSRLTFDFILTRIEDR